VSNLRALDPFNFRRFQSEPTRAQAQQRLSVLSLAREVHDAPQIDATVPGALPFWGPESSSSGSRPLSHHCLPRDPTFPTYVPPNWKPAHKRESTLHFLCDPSSDAECSPRDSSLSGKFGVQGPQSNSMSNNSFKFNLNVTAPGPGAGPSLQSQRPPERTTSTFFDTPALLRLGRRIKSSPALHRSERWSSLNSLAAPGEAWSGQTSSNSKSSTSSSSYGNSYSDITVLNSAYYDSCNYFESFDKLDPKLLQLARMLNRKDARTRESDTVPTSFSWKDASVQQSESGTPDRIFLKLNRGILPGMAFPLEIDLPLPPPQTDSSDSCPPPPQQSSETKLLNLVSASGWVPVAKVFEKKNEFYSSPVERRKGSKNSSRSSQYNCATTLLLRVLRVDREGALTLQGTDLQHVNQFQGQNQVQPPSYWELQFNRLGIIFTSFKASNGRWLDDEAWQEESMSVFY